MDARSHMLKEAGKLEKAGAEHGWLVATKDESNGHAGTETVITVTCVATRGQEVISIWWENKRLLEAPTYTLAGRVVKLRNASACVQQMAKAPDFEKSARRIKALKRKGLNTQDVEPDPDSLPWIFLEDPSDKDILRSCYAKSIVWRNQTTNEVETDVIVRSSDAFNKKGNFNASTYHISTSSTGRRILNFLGVFGFRSVAFDTVLRIGTSEEAAERTRKHLLELVAQSEKDKKKIVNKAVKKIDG